MDTLGKFSTWPKKIGIQLELCVITPKTSLSNLGGVKISAYLGYFLNKQLNFGNLALWLWKKSDMGLNLFWPVYF